MGFSNISESPLSLIHIDVFTVRQDDCGQFGSSFTTRTNLVYNKHLPSKRAPSHPKVLRAFPHFPTNLNLKIRLQTL